MSVGVAGERLTGRVWHAAAKSVRLNITPEGQRGSDVVGGTLDPSRTAGAVTSSTGYIMVQMRPVMENRASL